MFFDSAFTVGGENAQGAGDEGVYEDKNSWPEYVQITGDHVYFIGMIGVNALFGGVWGFDGARMVKRC